MLAYDVSRRLTRSLHDRFDDGFAIFDDHVEVDALSSVLLVQFLCRGVKLFGQGVDRNGGGFVRLLACVAQFFCQLLDAIPVQGVRGLVLR